MHVRLIPVFAVPIDGIFGVVIRHQELGPKFRMLPRSTQEEVKGVFKLRAVALEDSDKHKSGDVVEFEQATTTVGHIME